MSRKEEFEDDGRMIADMSGIEGNRLFGRRSYTSRAKQKDEEKDNILPVPPFTWQERVRYIVMALGAALLIGLVLLVGIAFIIWLFTLYA